MTLYNSSLQSQNQEHAEYCHDAQKTKTEGVVLLSEFAAKITNIKHSTSLSPSHSVVWNLLVKTIMDH